MNNPKCNPLVSSNPSKSLHSVIFSIEPILESIFRNLSFTQLKLCREVNSLWKLEATRSLLRNYTTKPIRSYSVTPGEFEFSLRNGLRIDAESFFNLVSRSQRFPCNNYSILGSFLEDACIQRILPYLGMSIKHLEIISKRSDDNQMALAKNVQSPLKSNGEVTPYFSISKLAVHIPKLQFLSLSGVPPECLYESWTKFFKLMNLTSLRKLDVRDTYNASSFDYIRDILTAAVNLRHVNYFDALFGGHYLKYLSVLIDCGRAHLVDDFTFVYNTSLDFNSYVIQEQMKIYQGLANAKPKLKSIKIILLPSITYEYEAQTYRPKLVEILSNTIHSSSDTLSNIMDFYPLLHFGAKIPRLPLLKNLSCLTGFNLDYIRFFEGNLRHFQPELNFNLTFPNLVCIFIKESHECRDRSQDSSFHWDRKSIVPHSSVKELFMGSSSNWPQSAVSPPIFDYLCRKFPNLTTVGFPLTFNFFEASQFIWTQLKQLKHLELCIGHDPERIQNSFPGLEAAFTGFSKEICFRLHENNQNGNEVDLNYTNLEHLRIYPSILNLTKLQSLEIQFDSRDYWDGWDPKLPLLTEITGLHAFAKCPQVKVGIQMKFDSTSQHIWTRESNPFLGVIQHLTSLSYYNISGLI